MPTRLLRDLISFGKDTLGPILTIKYPEHERCDCCGHDAPLRQVRLTEGGFMCDYCLLLAGHVRQLGRPKVIDV